MAFIAFNGTQGGGSVEINYSDLINKPSINGTELEGDKNTSDLKVSYNDISDKPKINGTELSGDKSTEDIGYTLPVNPTTEPTKEGSIWFSTN